MPGRQLNNADCFQYLGKDSLKKQTNWRDFMLANKEQLQRKVIVSLIALSALVGSGLALAQDKHIDISVVSDIDNRGGGSR